MDAVILEAAYTSIRDAAATIPMTTVSLGTFIFSSTYTFGTFYVAACQAVVKIRAWLI